MCTTEKEYLCCKCAGKTNPKCEVSIQNRELKQMLAKAYETILNINVRLEKLAGRLADE